MPHSQSFPLLEPDAEPGRLLRLSDELTHGPGAVVISRDAAERLTTVHRFHTEVEARETALGRERFAVDLPGVAPAELAHLGDDGVARVGTELAPGTVIVGKLTPKARPPEEDVEMQSQLAAVFGVSDMNVRDTSLRCAPGERGVVTRATLTPGSEKKPDVAEIEFEHTRAARVGDWLVLDDGASAVVAEVREALPGGVDVLWPGKDGPLRVSKRACAEDVLHGRSIGPYSLVTQQPLSGKRQRGGQRVSPAHLRALREAGARHTHHELLTVKSDHVAGRVELYEDIVRGFPEAASSDSAEAPAPTEAKMGDIFAFFERPANSLPRATEVLESELVAMGFDVDFTQPAVAIGLLGSEEMHTRSFGEVKKPETINYRTFLPENDGLFCARIFGPVKDYECICGALRQMKDRGRVCEKCGVEVIQSKVRARRFGHVRLASPVVHPFAIEVIASLLGLPEEHVRGVVRGVSGLDGAEAESFADTGPRALREALADLDLAALAGAGGRRGELASWLHGSGTPASALVLDVVPVLPPDLRPLVPLDGGRFATSDLNDLYRRLINRNNRLRRLLELSAPDIILRNEQEQLQQAIDCLFDNRANDKPARYQKRILKSLADMVSGPGGRLDQNLLAKRVDYSGVALAAPRVDLDRGRLRVPRSLARELFKPFVYCELERVGRVTTIKAAKKLMEHLDPDAEAALERVVADHPLLAFAAQGERAVGFTIELWDELAIGVASADLERLGLHAGGELAVHVPADPKAVAEVRRLDGAPPDPEPHREPNGWLAQLAATGGAGSEPLRGALLEAAMRRDVDPVSHWLACVVLGRITPG